MLKLSDFKTEKGHSLYIAYELAKQLQSEGKAMSDYYGAMAQLAELGTDKAMKTIAELAERVGDEKQHALGDLMDCYRYDGGINLASDGTDELIVQLSLQVEDEKDTEDE
jgi:hypothetical protein